MEHKLSMPKLNKNVALLKLIISQTRQNFNSMRWVSVGAFGCAITSFFTNQMIDAVVYASFGFYLSFASAWMWKTVQSIHDVYTLVEVEEDENNA